MHCIEVKLSSLWVRYLRCFVTIMKTTDLGLGAFNYLDLHNCVNFLHEIVGEYYFQVCDFSLHCIWLAL